MASLMPNGRQQYTDPKSGLPLAFGLLYTFAAGTLDNKITWADADEVTAHSNPILLDANGTASVFWDSGFYDIELKTRNSQLVYTASKLSIGTSTDTAPTAPPDVAPPQGLSFAINSVVDIVRMADNFGSGGDDTVAMQKAIRYAAQSGGKMYLRGGTTARIDATDFTGVREFWGDGPGVSIILPFAGLADHANFMTWSNPTNVGIRDLQVSLNTTTFDTQVVFQLTNPVNVELDNIYIPQAASCPVRSQGANGLKLKNIQVDAYGFIGLFALDSVSSVVFEDCTIKGTGQSHAMQVVGGGSHAIRDCLTDGAKLFGANFFNVNGGIISGNTMLNGYVEACNVQDTQNFQIIGNLCIQRRDGAATDFGMSVYGDPASGNPTKYGLIANNKIFGSAKSGIALATNVTLTTVHGNHIVSPNTLDEAFGAGILLYGSGCQHNHVHGNTIIDEGGKMRWGVNEWVGFGDGAPDANFIGQDDRVIVSGGEFIGENNLLGATSQAWDTEMVAYTPTIAAGTGAVTVVNAAKYRRRGKLVDVRLDVGITTTGTGASSVNITLPFTSIGNGGDLSGRDLFNGKAINGRCTGSSALFVNYDNSYPGESGANLIASGAYELA